MDIAVKKDVALKGSFLRGGAEIKAEIHYSSRFTLLANIIDPIKDFDEDCVYNGLNIEINGKKYEFGPCTIDSSGFKTSGSGIVIFNSDLYNFDDLFFKNKIADLKSISSNLSLILSQKDKVKTEFKEFVSSLNYDISVFKHFFDDLEKKMENESEHVKNQLTGTVINTAGRKFLEYFDSKVKELEEMIKDYTREDHEVHGFYLRKQLWHIIMTSELLAITNIKPRGYAGDSEMMRMLYDTSYRGASIFGKILYKYSLEHPAADSVRNRRVMIPKILSRVRKDFGKENSGIFKVMSVACGPAYELQDLFLLDDDVASFHFTLLDQDLEALNEARGKVAYIEKNFGKNINVTYLNESVRTMLMTPRLDEKWGRFDFIYSMGLFDYLTPPVAKAVIEKIYQLLEPGGQMLIGNYHVDNISKWYMEYWHDWVLYYRDEDEFRELLRDTGAENISIIVEDARCQMFLSAAKPYK